MLDGSAHCHHLADTIEPSLYGGNAVFLSNYFDHPLLLLLLYFEVVFVVDGGGAADG